MDWRERLPAEIVKAEAMVERGGNWVETKALESRYILTAGEVALVKALEQDHDAHWKGEALSEDDVVNSSCDEAECVPCAALREFGEKMEGLDG